MAVLILRKIESLGTKIKKQETYSLPSHTLQKTGCVTYISITCFRTAAAGRGTLSVGVRAAGQDVKHSIRDLGGGLYKVLFYPRAPIPHKVDVRYNGIPVQGEVVICYLILCPNLGCCVSVLI